MAERSKKQITGTLFIVGTPIGNLKDITLRAIETLKSVQAIYAEDTRVSMKLLNHFEIRVPLHSFHGHSGLTTYEEVVNKLEYGDNLALITDAGTPGVSDPGEKLVAYVRRANPNLAITVIPGVSAVTAALSISGIESAGFSFIGYPPHKKGRKKFFEKIKSAEPRPVILYESKHRIIRTLEELNNAVGETVKIVLLSDLTKAFERIVTGSISEVLEREKVKKPLGEYILIIE